MLVEAGNYAAYQRAYRGYPQMDGWQYPPSMLPGASPSPAELYYRQASIAALQAHGSPYGMFAGAPGLGAPQLNVSKPPAFPLGLNTPISPLSSYYQNMQRIPSHVNRLSVSPPLNPGSPSPKHVGSAHNSSDEEDDHIEV